MKIAAVIPVFNRKNLTLECISQLNAQSQDEYDLRIIIVDDGSTDGTAEAIHAAHPEVEVVRTEGDCWWTRTVNIGVARARELGCDAIYLTNDDVDYGPDHLAELVRSAKRHGEKSLVGSAVLNASTGRLVFAGYRVKGFFREPQGLFPGQSLDQLGSQDLRVDLLPGKSLLFPLALVDAIGLLDERHFPHNFGDMEYTLRATLAGFQCFVCPASTVSSGLNHNYMPLKIISSTRLEFLKCLFQRRYGFNIANIYATSFHMHKPFPIAVLYFMKQLARLAKQVLCKLLLPKSMLNGIFYSTYCASRLEPDSDAAKHPPVPSKECE